MKKMWTNNGMLTVGFLISLSASPSFAFTEECRICLIRPTQVCGCDIRTNNTDPQGFVMYGQGCFEGYSLDGTNGVGGGTLRYEGDPTRVGPNVRGVCRWR